MRGIGDASYTGLLSGALTGYAQFRAEIAAQDPPERVGMPL